MREFEFTKERSAGSASLEYVAHEGSEKGNARAKSTWYHNLNGTCMPPSTGIELISPVWTPIQVSYSTGIYCIIFPGFTNRAECHQKGSMTGATS
jgi:hypothetical protein